MPEAYSSASHTFRMKIIKDGAEREDDGADKDRRDDGPPGGHGLMYQYPDPFCETVLGFLDG